MSTSAAEQQKAPKATDRPRKGKGMENEAGAMERGQERAEGPSRSCTITEHSSSPG
jgi:hypothetical protein